MFDEAAGGAVFLAPSNPDPCPVCMYLFTPRGVASMPCPA